MDYSSQEWPRVIRMRPAEGQSTDLNVPIQFFHLGALLAGLPVEPSRDTFWAATIYSGVFAVVMNFSSWQLPTSSAGAHC